jgi:hypothetical protein
MPPFLGTVGIHDHSVSSLGGPTLNPVTISAPSGFARYDQIKGEATGTAQITFKGSTFLPRCGRFAFDLGTGQLVYANHNADVVLDISTAGPAVNGRDQAGAFTANTWISVFAIYNPTLAVGSRVGYIASANTPATGPSALPAGWLYPQWVFTLRCNASNFIPAGYIRGRWFWYQVAQATVATNFWATTETTLSVATYVPPENMGCSQFKANIRYGAATAGTVPINADCKYRVLTGVDYMLNTFIVSLANDSEHYYECPIFPNVSQQVFNILTNLTNMSTQNTSFQVMGYECGST